MRKVFAGLAVLAMAGMVLAAGRPGVVKLKDGKVYDGTVEEKTDSVMVTVRGIDTNIPRGQVESITYGTFEERWNAEYAKLPKDDSKLHVAMGRQAFDERRYDLAEMALRDAMTIDPNNAEAAELLKLTLNQRKLERNNGGGAHTGSPTPPDTVKPPVEPGETTRIQPWKTLTPEEVNRIKQVEFSPADEKLRINFKNDVIKKYLEANPNEEARTFAAFNKLPKPEQAFRIIKHGGELAKDVEIAGDPAIFMSYRRDVLPLVLQNCATSSCHGGSNEASAKFGLISPAADQTTVYTDFYVLQTTKQKLEGAGDGGMFAPAMAYMINRNQPEKSLLLQYGLPANSAEMKHPQARGYTPLFQKGTADPKYAAVKNFIGSLNRLEPDYGIDFKLERLSGVPVGVPAVPLPATAPASGPSTAPGAATGGAGK
jgi:hypothetical protein